MITVTVRPSVNNAGKWLIIILDDEAHTFEYLYPDGSRRFVFEHCGDKALFEDFDAAKSNVEKHGYTLGVNYKKDK